MVILAYFKHAIYILTYSKRGQALPFIFSRGVLRALFQTSKMKPFVKVINDFQSLTIFAKGFNLDV